MTSRLDLPDEQHAILCAPRKVSERKRNRHQSAMFALNAATADIPRNPEKPDEPDVRHLGPEHNELLKAAERALILCFVREWSYGEISEDALLDLPGDAYDVLAEECNRLLPEMRPDFSPDPDPKARTSEPSEQPNR
jgi:hypothetical protein